MSKLEAQLQPIVRTRLSHTVVDRLRAFIRRQQLQPGDRLPSERSLRADFGVSQNSVREALRILETLGVIDVFPGKGAFIRDDAAGDARSFADWLTRHRETLESHFEARLILEPSMCALAVRRMTPAQLTEMQEVTIELENKITGGDLLGAVITDGMFHRTIARAAHNKTLLLFMDGVLRFFFEQGRPSLQMPGRMETTATEHRKILKAFETRDPAAARAAMKLHLGRALSRYMKYVPKS